jgi:hypothetical protein
LGRLVGCGCTDLLDHLVGGGEQRFRDGEAGRLGGLAGAGLRRLEPGRREEALSLFIGPPANDNTLVIR